MRNDIRHKIKGRKAYMSYIRAYAKMKDKAIFHPKKLNLQLLVFYEIFASLFTKIG